MKMETNHTPHEIIKEALKSAGIMPGITTDLIINLVDLGLGEDFPNDTKWQARVQKAIAPLDVEDRVKSQYYTAARKELDTEAMSHFRRTGEHKSVTVADIDKRFQEKWDEYLAKKAEKEAKKKALAKSDR